MTPRAHADFRDWAAETDESGFSPHDRSMLPPPPWQPEQVAQWEWAHGHDIRLGCEIEGCHRLMAEYESMIDYETHLREAVAEHPWSFKEGTLRERLEWARAQHQLAAGRLTLPEPPESVEKHNSWHAACALWYAQMVRDLDATLAESAR